MVVIETATKFHVLLTFHKVQNPLRVPGKKDIWPSKWSKPYNFWHFWLGIVFHATPACTFSTSERQKEVRTLQFLTLLTWNCASRHTGVHFFDIATSKSAPRPSVFLHFWLGNVLRATTPCTFLTSQLPKVLRDRQFLTLLTWTCDSRHDGVHFFDIKTSKNAPRPSIFYTFDSEMCFAPQRRGLFWHLNVRKWSEREVFLALLLQNMLRATTVCNFHLSSGRRFSEPTFLPSGAPNHWKNNEKTQWIATFLPFRAPASSFFSLFLFSDLLSSLIFSSLTLPTSAFPSVHIVGSLTSKLPWIIGIWNIYLHLPQTSPTCR